MRQQVDRVLIRLFFFRKTQETSNFFCTIVLFALKFILVFVLFLYPCREYVIVFSLSWMFVLYRYFCDFLRFYLAFCCCIAVQKLYTNQSISVWHFII